MTKFQNITTSYVHLYTNYFHPKISSPPSLEQLISHPLTLPVFPILIAFHCVFAADIVHRITNPPGSAESPPFFLKSIILTVSMAFGGSVTASLLAGLPIPLFDKPGNTLFLNALVAWWLIQNAHHFRNIYRVTPVRAVGGYFAAIARCRAIFSFMDAFVKHRPNAWFATILLGGLAGSAGALLVGFDKTLQTREATEISKPSVGFKAAFVIATGYYMVKDPDSILLHNFNWFIKDKYAATLAITYFFPIIAAAQILSGKQFNPFYYVEQFLYSVTRIPQPSAEAQDETTKVIKDSHLKKE